MSSGRACVLGFALAIEIGATGCTDDFHALFVNGPTADDASTSKPDGAGGAPDATSDAGPSSGCGSPSACSPQASCGSGTCGYTCGCGCKCTDFSCPTTGGACNFSCETGTTCNVACDVAAGCTGTAQGSNATFQCTQNAGSCDVTCNHASCNVTCDNQGPCSVRCGDDAQCVLRCTSRPSSCNLTCNEAVRKDCGNGVFTCSPTCP